MKHVLFAAFVALASIAAPLTAQAQNFGTITPTLDFPQPAPEPVTRDLSQDTE